MRFATKFAWGFPVAGLTLGLLIPAATVALALFAALSFLMASAVVGTLAGGLLFGIGSWIARRERRLVAMSMRDPLTGLWNRAALNERLEAELKRASRRQAPLALILVDLDRLKTINDRHGHLAGDAALEHVAECLRNSCRSSDIACRIGGDEFAIVAPDTDERQARNLAERIRKGVTLFPVAVGGESIATSVSIGVADVVPTLSVSATGLLQYADELLYAAKVRGRDGIVVGDEAEKPRGRQPLRAVPRGRQTSSLRGNVLHFTGSGGRHRRIA